VAVAVAVAVVVAVHSRGNNGSSGNVSCGSSCSG
jgi:hypothetical protein